MSNFYSSDPYYVANSPGAVGGGFAAGGPDPRELAKQKTVGPGIALMVVGLLGFLGMAGYLIVTIAGLIMDPSTRTPPPNMQEGERVGYYIGFYGMLVLLALNPLLQLVIAFGGFRMMRLQSRGLAMTACILALIPCSSSCCLFGIPFGLWGLIVLNDRNVSGQFH
ncbi:MAG: hypothetical protein KDA85_17205 [Planctomycetaceae bacterium]|nr:hypothetical protein [Planctomycetaceae bacterium]